MWVVAAIVGWVLALVAWGLILASVWPSRQPPLRAVPGVGRLVELRSASGQVESVRSVRGSDPPLELVRPHGRDAAVTYKQVSRDGSRWVYQAER